MNNIDTVGRLFLAAVAVCTFIVAANMEVKANGGGAWNAIALATVWAVPWLVGGTLALSAAAGSAPW